MRRRFQEKIEIVSKELIEMGALIERAVTNAMDALYYGEMDKADMAISLEIDIDNKEREIENLCFNILMTEQPVAGDLRLISSAAKMVTDMERVGDQAADIAEIAKSMKKLSLNELPELQQMSGEAMKMLKDSIDAFVDRNLELAHQVVKADDIVDNLFVELGKVLMEMIKKDVENAQQALDLLMVIKYLERIADHACNIALSVIFAITGEHEDD